MIKAIIIDDEPLAIEVLETLLSDQTDIEIVGTGQNAIEANELLKNHDVDLMFLDIQMPQLTGIEFLKFLTDPPQVIFTTAYPEHAVDGFALNATDYLLKPIPKDRLNEALDKVREKLGKSTTDEEKDFIFVKADKKYVRINYDAVFYIEGLKDYVIIKTEEKRIVTLQTMKSLEQKLHGPFMRVHRSYIVNIDKIQSVLGNTIEMQIGSNKAQIPVGKNYRDELHEIINNYRL